MVYLLNMGGSFHGYVSHNQTHQAVDPVRYMGPFFAPGTPHGHWLKCRKGPSPAQWLMGLSVPWSNRSVGGFVETVRIGVLSG